MSIHLPHLPSFTKFAVRNVTTRMSSATSSLDVVLRDIGPEDITSHFQPIVELLSGSVIGYEILSRGPAPYESPTLLFSRARELGLSAELENACRSAALSRVAGLSPRLRQSQWFLNVSPEVFCAGAEQLARVVSAIRKNGIEPSQIVLEITERAPIANAGQLGVAARHYAAEGFRIAIDDFGSGVNGLLTLVACRPQIIKLDMELTRGMDSHSYKQLVVRSIASLAESVNAQLIAEGVETPLELAALREQGVKFAQGRLFGKPAPHPAASATW